MMPLDFQLPHITGQTTGEQVTQIVSYLRQLAMLLQQLPVQAHSAETSTAPLPRSQSFSTLKVRDRLQLDGSLNGIVLDSVQLRGSTLQLQTAMSDWDTATTGAQLLFLLGSYHGCIHVTGAGVCSWTGEAGVTVTKGEKGVVTVTFPQPVSEKLMILSSHKFRSVQ